MMKIKQMLGIILLSIILTVIFTVSPISKMVRNFVNDLVGKNGNNTYIKASFSYTNLDGKTVHDGEKIYVFISQEENGGGNRVALELKANNGEQIVTQIYDQNGGSNSNENLDGQYYVKVAIPKPDHLDDKFESNKNFDQNNYIVYKSGDSYNGSYVISYDGQIDIKSSGTKDLKIEIKERNGERLSASKILEPLDFASGFGIFARDVKITADVEATIAVEKAEEISSDFGLSENNYKGIKAVKENGNVIVNKTFTKNSTSPMPKQGIKILLTNKVNSNDFKTEFCTTNEKGECSVIFENVEKGNYILSEEIDGQKATSDTTITTKNGENIDVKFSNNEIIISEYTVEDKAFYNYNYVGKSNSDNNKVDLSKMRGPGVLVVDDESLYTKFLDNSELKSRNIELTKPSDKYKRIDFDSEFKKFDDLSVKLANSIDSDDVKVYYLKSDDIKNSDIDFKSENKEYILVNVDCTNTNEITIGGRNKRDGVSLYTDGNASNGNQDNSFVYNNGAKIIYNFYVKENSKIKTFSGHIKTDDQSTGILLAPDATVDGAKGNHAGTIIAKDYNHTTGEVHQKVKPKWISTDSAVASITNNITEQEQHEEHKFEVDKVDADGNPIAGAELQLLDKSGKEIDRWITNNQTHQVKEDLVVGQTYTVKELKAPEGYQKAQDYTFTYDGKTTEKYTMVNTKIVVDKLDENQGYLSGAVLQIVDEKDNVIEEWITDGKQHIVKENLNVGQTYYLREKEAPIGYKKSDDVKFVVSSDDKDQTVKMRDQKIVINVFVEKIDWNDKLLAGSHLQLLNSKGELVEDWISSDEVYEVQAKLEIGEKYTLHELSSPEGYETSPDVVFEVENTEDSQIVTMVDKKIIIKGEPFVKISKIDKDGNLLSGAELQLLDSDGNVIEEWTSNDKEHNIDAKLEVGKQYTLHEVSAPKGYQRSEDITFTAKADEQQVTMIDNRIRKVAGVVETIDNISKYLMTFFVTLVVLTISFTAFTKINKKKLSK